MSERNIAQRLQDEADLCHDDGAHDIAQLLEEGVRALEYYQAIAQQRAPKWVPARVYLPDAVRGDGLGGADDVVDAGEHDCQSNQWGAVSVEVSKGRRLGVRLYEFEVVAWVLNTASPKGGAA
jgi:hypothetical protein